MGRKDLFQPAGGKSGVTAPPAPPRMPGSGAGSAPLTIMKRDLSNTLRSIHADLIDGSAWADRIPGADPNLDSLVESFRSNGQLVPALVRPSAKDPARFEIIYGRRRLAAAKELDIPLKAIVAQLDDQAALIAQGAENNQRLDPSFIEKAIFASQLMASGDWSAEVVCETLAIHRSILSQMEKVVRDIGADLLVRIGPCHSVGRRPLVELAEQVNALRHRGIDINALELLGETDMDRLESLRQQVTSLIESRSAPEVEAAVSKVQAEEATAPKKKSVSRKLPFGPKKKIAASLDRSHRAISLRFNRTKDTEGFDEWLNENVDDVLETIQSLWLKDKKKPGE